MKDIRDEIIAARLGASGFLRISPEQKDSIRRLRKKLDHDRLYLTYQDRRLGISEADIGKRVDDWLDNLSQAEASALIDKLTELV